MEGPCICWYLGICTDVCIFQTLGEIQPPFLHSYHTSLGMQGSNHWRLYPVYYTAALDAKIGQGDVGISGLSDMRNCDPILHEEPNYSRRVWAEGGGTRKGGDDHEGRARTQRQVLNIKEGQRKRSEQEGRTMERREVLTKKE